MKRRMSAPMKKYTNHILAGLFLLGLLITLIVMGIVRYRLNQIIEITI